ncbi:protein Wnt-5-like [Styela clava]|uniref:protein Wnt-5-like n=1 Tax=Styela clava TaxID=7725 RepID=UPI00193AD47B|nr:protein Wnt-5-like [Styela clava]
MDTDFRRHRSILPVIIVVLSLSWSQVNGHWWSVATDPNIDKLEQGITSICEHFKGLSRNQEALCKRYHNHMSFVSEGAESGIQECQHQFSGHRWNCSTVEDSTVFGKVLNIGSKEIAFTYAIASAGVVHSIAKGCKSAELKSCGCSKKPRPTGLHNDWRWGGCGDDTDYAYGFAREFIDARERDNVSPRGQKAKARKAMNLHNNEAGRMAVVRGTRPACRCHGVSGSCSLKTCWFQVPDFRVIGDKLRQAHVNAIEMRMSKRGQIRPRKSGRGKPVLTDLIFIESSPDYCKRNSKTGVPGTRGRECNKNSSGDDGCGLLCCGRGFRRQDVTVVERCNCKFQWCCTVRCEKCRKTVVKHFCR